MLISAVFVSFPVVGVGLKQAKLITYFLKNIKQFITFLKQVIHRATLLMQLVEKIDFRRGLQVILQ